MQFLLKVAVSLLSAAALAVAAPTTSPNPSVVFVATSDHRPELERRATGGIYICADINWGGKCVYAIQPLRTCIDFGNDWNDIVSSFGPDSGTSCMIFADIGCSNSQMTILSYPGSSNLVDISFNDIMSSFECWPTGELSGHSCTYCPTGGSCSTVDCSNCVIGSGTCTAA
ncbi:hypothetical protein RUND412_005331 [Rhizina undulata]